MSRTRSHRDPGSRQKRTYVAFLRGINVGGKNLVSMAKLAAMFEAIGCAAVRTYIQSGNVVFEATASLARRVPDAIGRAIYDEAGLTIPLVVRTSEELTNVSHANPFLARGTDPKTLHVAFLADVASAARVAVLDSKRSPPDEILVREREIYLRLPNGVARTRFTNAYLDTTLGTVSTLRSMSTVAKLCELCREGVI
jgi:uncharacterized protein (DUF1697 family)